MRHLLLAAALLVPQAFAHAESAGGLTWTAPPGWTAEGAKGMRAATYRLAPVKPDTEQGECAVFFFGQGQGGTVEANVQRWVGQFDQPGGKSSSEVVKTKKETLAGLSVTTLDLTGSYKGMGGPMGPPQPARPGYRLLGAIVEGPQGPVFFKCTGPEKTLEAARKDFRALLKSISRG